MVAEWGQLGALGPWAAPSPASVSGGSLSCCFLVIRLLPGHEGCLPTGFCSFPLIPVTWLWSVAHEAHWEVLGMGERIWGVETCHYLPAVTSLRSLHRTLSTLGSLLSPLPGLHPTQVTLWPLGIQV